MGFVSEIVSADGHSHAGTAPAIRAHPGRNTVAERQQDFVCLRDADGDIYDIVAGRFFIVGLGQNDFTDLPHDLAEQFAEQFRQPEMFVREDGKIVAAPMPDEQAQGGMSY